MAFRNPAIVLSLFFESCGIRPLFPSEVCRMQPFSIYVWLVFTVWCFSLFHALWKRTVVQRYPFKATMHTVRLQDRISVRRRSSMPCFICYFHNDVRSTFEIERYGRRRLIAKVLLSGWSMVDIRVLSVTTDIVVVYHRRRDAGACAHRSLQFASIHEDVVQQLTYTADR